MSDWLPGTWPRDGMSDEWTTDDMPHICQSYIDRAEKAEAALERIVDGGYLPEEIGIIEQIARKALEAGAYTSDYAADSEVKDREAGDNGEGTPPGGNQ